MSDRDFIRYIKNTFNYWLKDKKEKCNLYKKLQRWVARFRGMHGLDCRRTGDLDC